jgi:hypothetical protein
MKPVEATNDIEAPDHFICPLTLEVMVHPLMTRLGHSFERSAILAWLKRNDINPLTREPLGLRDLVINRGLQAEIRRWKAKNYEDQVDSETEASSDDDSVDSKMLLCFSTMTLEELESRIRFDGGSGGSEYQNPPSRTTVTRGRRLGSRFGLGGRRRR